MRAVVMMTMRFVTQLIHNVLNFILVNCELKAVTILALKVKTGSDCKTDVKYEFLDDKNRRIAISICNISQTIDKLISKMSEGGHFGFWVPASYAHTSERVTLSYFLI